MDIQMRNPDVFYIHGYEGSPQGTKGSWLSMHFSFFGPEMPDARTSHPLGNKAPIAEVIQEIRSAIAPSACDWALSPDTPENIAPRILISLSYFAITVFIRLCFSVL